MLTVSVVMCTYNGACFIREQLDSILAQTYPAKEVIIFDDASNDETPTIIKDYAQKHNHIRFHQNQSNIGFTLNFEQALKAATCDVIAISDQDDYWHPEKLKTMLQVWKEDTQLIYCDSFRFSGDIPLHIKNSRFRRFEGTDVRKIFLFNAVSGHALMLKRTLLPLIFPFQPGIMYDWWMGVVAGCNGGVSFVPEVLVYQRIHQNNVTIGKGHDFRVPIQRLTYKKMVLRHLQQFIKVPGLDEKRRRFAKEFLALWSTALLKRFYLPLFIFLLKNRQILFWYRKKPFAIFSRIKHSYRFVYNKLPQDFTY
jgi:glycosyltransferase involved in cell wall biosynthesis